MFDTKSYPQRKWAQKDYRKAQSRDRDRQESNIEISFPDRPNSKKKALDDLKTFTLLYKFE